MTAISVERGVGAYMAYHRANSRPNSIRTYDLTLSKFKDAFAGADMSAIRDFDIVSFLDGMTAGHAPATKNSRAGHLRSLYNFIQDAFGVDIINPCARGLVKKLYKKPRHVPPTLPDKEVIDEIIYRADGRDRLMLELMGRTAMRIGEVLNIRPRNLNREVATISIEQPKSGRQGEVASLTKRIMRNLDAYARELRVVDDARVFPISYTTAYRRVRKMGEALGVRLRPHDLRRHAATQASRAGMPLEVVSKVVLRHRDIATTQRYLGLISQDEASRMVETYIS